MRRIRVLTAIVAIVAVVAVAVIVSLPWSIPISLWTSSRMRVWVGDQSLDLVRNPGNGMVGISDLGSLDGMLFELLGPSKPGDGGGWQMLGVTIPLDVAFFAPSAELIAMDTMQPCPAEPCPVHTIDQPYMWVIESEVGTLNLQRGDLLRYP